MSFTFKGLTNIVHAIQFWSEVPHVKLQGQVMLSRNLYATKPSLHRIVLLRKMRSSCLFFLLAPCRSSNVNTNKPNAIANNLTERTSVLHIINHQCGQNSYITTRPLPNLCAYKRTKDWGQRCHYQDAKVNMTETFYFASNTYVLVPNKSQYVGIDLSF